MRRRGCILNAKSATACFWVLARTGGRYACLEGFRLEWQSRRAVKVKQVMGYEGLGRNVRFEGAQERGNVKTTTYTRSANPVLAALCARWAGEMQSLLDSGSVKHHPVREISAGGDGDWADAIIKGLLILQRGEVRGNKLVVRFAAS
ncbi:hypothetical protein F4825DRAFT_454975 [Nemania diffusa]|nr:hypothetical protein F4825DRAFT_454975 [Nemania diffusa]